MQKWPGLCLGRKLNNLHVLLQSCNTDRSSEITENNHPILHSFMALKHVLLLVFILTLLKQFQSNMSDTEIRISECLYFETQISFLANLHMIKTRQKKLSVKTGM